MKIHRIDHVGVIVNDLSAAKLLFLDCRLEIQRDGELEGNNLLEIPNSTAGWKLSGGETKSGGKPTFPTES
jgi:hypothetical protein